MAKFATIRALAKENFSVLFFRTLAILVLAGIFFVTGGGISQHEAWKIQHIKVSGAGAVSSDNIVAAVQERLLGNYYFVYSRGNSYLFPEHEIEKMLLETFPRLAMVYAHRADDHTVAIEVTERKPYALWCGEVYLREMYELNDCWFVDDTGFVFDRAPIFSEGVYPEVYGVLESVPTNVLLRGRLPRERFVFAHAFEKLLAQELGKFIRIIIKDHGEYGVVIRSSERYPVLNGVEVRFKDGQDAQVLIKNLVASLPVQFPPDIISKKKLLYIDMRFDKKVFFGFEN